jgi:hypothetical protein
MRASFIFTAAIAFMAVAGSASADTIYSNFGAGQTYNTADPLSTYNLTGFLPYAYAVSFTPTGNYKLDSVSVALTVITARHGQTAGVTIYSDSGGKPDAVLEDMGTQFVPAASNAIYTFSPSTDLMLSGGITYWLAVLPPLGNQVYWNYSLGDAHGYAQTINNATSWTALSTSKTTLAFAVAGTPAAVATVPLPSAAWAGLALLPLAGLFGRRDRRIA